MFIDLFLDMNPYESPNPKSGLPPKFHLPWGGVRHAMNLAGEATLKKPG
jgi:hypothetical protein